MSEQDDAIQAIDELKGKLTDIGNLGDVAAQINDLYGKLGELGNLGETAQKINQVQNNLKLGDKLKEVLTKLTELSKEFPHEQIMAVVTGLLTLGEVIKGLYELKSIGDTMVNISSEIVASNEEGQTTLQAMDGLAANLQATSQLADIATKITDLQKNLGVAVGNLGDVNKQLTALTDKLNAAEDKIKAIPAA